MLFVFLKCVIILADEFFKFQHETNIKMFEIFKTKKKSFVGIDFGTSCIKVVEISCNDQKNYLENYGVVDLNFLEQDEKDKNEKNLKVTYEQKMNDALKKLTEKMLFKKGLATYVSIPGFSGLITIIDLPEMSQDELTKAIQFEAHKYIPSSLEEVAMSWEIIEEYIDPARATAKSAGKRLKILLVAAPKKDIDHFGELVGGTNLEVKAIELETFSITRALVGEDRGTFFIIDIGSRATNIILVEKGVIKVNRNIDAGGNEITAAIAEMMEISKKRAEVFKKGDKDLLNTNGSALIIPVLELIVGESKRIINTYKEKNADAKIDTILLSGGTAQMKGLDEYFSRCFGEKVVLADPWSRINIENPEVKNLTKKFGGTFTVALGLALRGVEECKQK